MSLQVGRGEILTGIDFRFAPIKSGTWRNITYLDGLVDIYVTPIHRDADGVLWFATFGGVSCYNGREFSKLTLEDGLPENLIHDIHCASDQAGSHHPGEVRTASELSNPFNPETWIPFHLKSDASVSVGI